MSDTKVSRPEPKAQIEIKGNRYSGDWIIGTGLEQGEAREIADKIKTGQQLIQEELDRQARFTLEVMFGTGFSMHNPAKGALTFWQKGALDGSGDNKLYVCPNDSCNAIIQLESANSPTPVCLACNSVWKQSNLVGEILAYIPVKKWGELVFSYFKKMGMDADIRVKYHPHDIREAARLEKARQHHGELLAVVRQDTTRLYPLRDIIKETSAGGDMLACITRCLYP